MIRRARISSNEPQIHIHCLLRLFKMRLPGILTAVSLLLAPLISALSHEQIDPQLSNLFGNDTTTDGHTNNWAVLVCSSRYWFNYRVNILLL